VVFFCKRRVSRKIFEREEKNKKIETSTILNDNNNNNTFDFHVCQIFVSHFFLVLDF